MKMHAYLLVCVCQHTRAAALLENIPAGMLYRDFSREERLHARDAYDCDDIAFLAEARAVSRAGGISFRMMMTRCRHFAIDDDIADGVDGPCEKLTATMRLAQKRARFDGRCFDIKKCAK